MSKFKVMRSEEEVGILCKVGESLKRFQGDFKSRFSDFHVNEIDPNGKIIQLTCLEAPQEKQSEYAEDDPQICEWIPENVRKEIASLNERLENAGKNRVPKSDTVFWKEKVFIKVTALDKEQRTKIHKWMYNFVKLASETVDKDGDKFIVALFDNKQNIRRRRPAARAKFTHFVLYKEGVDTSEAIGQLTKKLRIKPNFLTFCGTKDKHGKTTQRMCASNIDASRLIHVSNELKSIKLGNFEYLPYHLRLGDLKGNHFKILLRNVIADSDESIASVINNVKCNGFINYFGLQRFGCYEISTHAVGKKILQNKWIEAFDMILAPKNNDADFMIKAKEEWLKNRNPDAAIKLLPHWHRSIESGVLHGLAKYYSKNDFIGVFLKLPRNTRHLYIHSFQSFLWNKVASFRINEMGLKPAVGDLVYEDKEQNDFFVEEIVDTDEETDDDTNGKGPSSGAGVGSIARSIRVKTLTQEDLPNYSIFDEVIPVQGTQIHIPAGIISDYYQKILSEEGLKMDCFLSFKPMADQPKGAYRKLVVQPQNVSCKIIPYNDSDNVDTFIPSEIDKLRVSEQNGSKTDDGKDQSALDADTSLSTSADEMGKSKKCVIVELSLPASSYATMALREVIVSNNPSENKEISSTEENQKEGKRSVDVQDTDEPEAKRVCKDNDVVEISTN